MERLRIVVGLLVVVLTASCCLCRATTDALADYKAAKQKALAPLQAEYERIVGPQREEPAMRKWSERLVTVDQIVERLLMALHACKARSAEVILDRMLSGQGTASAGLSAAVPSFRRPRWVDVLTLLDEYRQAFEEEVCSSSSQPARDKFLQEYYDKTVGTAEACVANEGQAVLALVADEQSMKYILQLSVVFPFLRTADRLWSRPNVESLAAWIREPRNAEYLVGFSLHAKRPMTAFAFACSGGRENVAPVSVVDFLQAGVRKMISERDDWAAMVCCRAGLEIADMAGAENAKTAFSFYLAEVLDRVNHPLLAAEEMMMVMGRCSDSGDYGKAALRRLTYLYSAGRNAELLSAASALRTDNGRRTFLPEVMFVSWAALRRETVQRSGEVKRDFLKSFPQHPLAAEMHFESALDALKNADPERAVTYLRVIEESFPKSALLPQVHEVQRRLRKATASN